MTRHEFTRLQRIAKNVLRSLGAFVQVIRFIGGIRFRDPAPLTLCRYRQMPLSS